MTAQSIYHQPIPLVANGAIVAYRAVGWNGAQATSATAFGFVGFAATRAVDGETFNCATGLTAIAEAGAAVGQPASGVVEYRLMLDTSGRVIPWTTGNKIVAMLIQNQAAAAAGQLVEVFPIPQGY